MLHRTAQGLYQKGIIESGAVESLGMRVTEQSIARQVSEVLLNKLNISATEVDKLQTVPYQQLNQAGDEALREVATRLGLKDGFNNPGNMSWAPVMDGDFLPQQPDASQKVSRPATRAHGAMKRSRSGCANALATILMQ